jgi:signal recognition particle subunit SRP54
MFDNLSDKLQRVFKNLRGEGRLSAQNMEDALREIRMALLEADVHFRVVKQFIEQVKEKALGEEVLTALSPGQQVVKVVRDELVKMLGGHQSRLRFANEPPSVILMVGLQGSGKTTTTAKLARVLSKEGARPQLVSVDVYRPAARQQLAILAKQIGMPAYEGIAGETPLELARGARREAVQTGRDVVLVDTAGRQHIDDQLMQELIQLKEALAPTEILFVADAMTGQDAVRSADEFHKRLGITGSVLTKMDGDARGGAALSIRSVTGQPLKYVGVGERVDALEAFHPDRVAERILGMGDVLSLIEKVEETIDRKQAEKMQEKLLAGDEFTLEDFRDQIKQIRKLGPLEGLLKMMPGAGALKELKDAKIDEKEVTRIVAIVDSMTPRERRNHMIINGSRRRRIAKGSGTSVQEINNLLKQYAQARKMMKSFSGVAGLLGKKGGKLKLPGLPGF